MPNVSKQLRSNPHLCLACAALCVAVAIYGQQTGEKRVRANQASMMTDPVMISGVAVAGKPIECGLFLKPLGLDPVTPFQAGSDWLQQMTISFINRTNKTIAAGGIFIEFLDTGECSIAQPCAGTELRFGQLPAIDAYDGRTSRPLTPERSERPPLDWKPEQTIVVRLSDYMPQVEESLQNFIPVTAVTKVTLHRGPFFFDDGMTWTPGAGYSVPDPDHPGKFNKLPPDYFPGKRGRNWPPGYNQ
jgi:hypothetical protein